MTEKNTDRMNKIIADAHENRRQRELTYREQALKLYPWICGRCMREFTHANLRELTVHHRDHDHDNNPIDGSNWELLCLYCHDNEHQRLTDTAAHGASDNQDGFTATHNPFAALGNLVKKK